MFLNAVQLHLFFTTGPFMRYRVGFTRATVFSTVASQVKKFIKGITDSNDLKCRNLSFTLSSSAVTINIFF